MSTATGAQPVPTMMTLVDAPEVERPRGGGTLPAILTVARRRKWLLIGIVAVVMAAGLAITLLTTPRYTASALLEIQRENRDMTDVSRTAQQSAIDMEFYETQYGLLRSEALAERVANNLRLPDNPEFFKTFKLNDDWFEQTQRQPGTAGRDARLRTAAAILLGNFSVSPARQSRLVTISFTSADPALSARVVNAWSASFADLTVERRYEATAHARRFLEERLGQLRTRIEEAERNLVNYATNQGIVNLPGVPAQGNQQGTPERSLEVEDLAMMNQELARARADRITAQSRLNGAPPDATSLQAVSNLRQQRAQLQGEYARLMVQFQPDYPPAAALRQQIGQIDAAIASEEGRARSTVQSALQQAYQSAVEREQNLQGRVQAAETSVLDLRRRSIQYNIFQRDTDTNRQLYDALLQRYKEIGVAGGVGANNIAVVDEAEVPTSPSSPNLPLNMALALLAGLALGAAAVFIVEQLDQAVRDPAELEKIVGIPMLGTVPRSSDGEPLESLRDPKSVLSEAYLSLQTTLQFATSHGFPRSLAITSSRPSEGKTTTSLALATMLARSGRKVLIVDGDMRSPSIHLGTRLSNRAGLSNYLSGTDDLDALIHPAASTPNLSVMPAGPQPPSAPELLADNRLKRLLDTVESRFDHVIVDAPPVMGLADAPLIARQMEGTIFVVEFNSTAKGMARVAVDRLRTSGAPLIGTVLTKFDSKRANYGYGYDYGYGYGYGDQAKPADVPA